ncbi:MULTISPECIES: ATP synthase F1 subunit delta [Enterococcus]|uniref:ATP synthase subunit delta n=1 Tax=Enterococcus malodoratus ATCC 43197 TaxID=1158601 RepID=R2R6G0_9ENTE|nr:MULTISPECIES: ATP synthase F1 subunit delta [Enterococcus]BBM19240.1 ATP synthase subunit delta [Enterococcus avium]EOH71554.1 ATP synthase F1, delta subunit [Enterococcus malodoratus ATCC 43197]EOT69756.1 ATP synthase F1, delta subunit [Enterococcus malodoratus ATCC 43197]MDN6585355.1 F0F1 ATP synthase subunit delta [Enterococcus sp.]SES86947.1 F-type H+-transporting ATPase subunit delta [Enterococcus malodoratus]
MKLDKYTVGKRYGKALFELAIENEAADAVYQELLTIREICKEIPDLGNILTDVRLEGAEKKAIMDAFTGGFDGIVKNFLLVVFEYNRSDDLPFMIDEFERRYDEMNKVAHGTVTTAVPLSEEKKHELEAKVADVFGYQKASLTPIVDESILGGVIVEADHQVIDGSLASQLNGLRAALSKK